MRKTLYTTLALTGITLCAPFHSFATSITFGGTSVKDQGVTSSVPGTTDITFQGGSEPSNYSGGSVVSGSVENVYRTPTSDSSKYLTTGTGTVTLDFSANPVNYFGLYWGSVDSYNTLTVFDGNHMESFTGTQVANEYGINPDGATSFYANFYASPNTSWNKITLSSTENAFESDNHAYVVATPEPASWTMLAAGMLVTGIFARRRIARVV